MKREYYAVCKAIDEALIEEHGGIYCSSCNILVATPSKSIRNWGHSHLLPKGRFPEFENEIWNLSPRCQDFLFRKGCHEALDRSDFEKIKDFKDLEEIMDTLAEYHPSTYNKFVSGLISVGMKKYSYKDLDK